MIKLQGYAYAFIAEKLEGGDVDIYKDDDSEMGVIIRADQLDKLIAFLQKVQEENKKENL
jgi:hypothetical protein